MDNTPRYEEASNATAVMVLGIVGIFFNIVAPVAWVLGNQELEAIRAGRRPPEGESNAKVGRILGIVGTALLAVGVAVLIGLVALIIWSAS
jgi:hypothetical protein